jgi:hypothetical protein
MNNLAAFTTVNRVAKLLPIPLVGSVLYDGCKTTRECTPKAFAAFVDCMARAAPKRILEIGTHAGGSALIMLALSEASILSVDIGHTWIMPHRSFADWGAISSEGGLNQVEAVLKSAFPGRFDLYIGDSTALGTLQYLTARQAEQPFDTAFVDGNHDPAYIAKDIATCLALGIRKLILDDFNCETPKVAAAAGLRVEKEWTDIHSGGVSFCLCRAI